MERRGNNYIEQTNCNKETKKEVIMRYLFVCNLNSMRSPAVAAYFEKLIEEKNINAVVESAGISDDARRKLTKKMVGKANVIFAMDEAVYRKIVQKYSPPQNKLVNLDILDVYEYDGKIYDALLESSIRRDGEGILKRPEIRERLRFYQVLEMKKPILERYIKRLTS
jgi:predicted protein tyrosine phosphatase